MPYCIKEDFLDLKRCVRETDKKLAALLDGINRLFLALKRECETYRVLGERFPYFSETFCIFLLKWSGFWRNGREEKKEKKFLSCIFRSRAFLYIHDIMDENYVIYSELEADGRFKVKLFCINPAVNLQNYLEQGNGTIFLLRHAASCPVL